MNGKRKNNENKVKSKYLADILITFFVFLLTVKLLISIFSISVILPVIYPAARFKHYKSESAYYNHQNKAESRRIAHIAAVELI